LPSQPPLWRRILPANYGNKSREREKTKKKKFQTKLENNAPFLERVRERHKYNTTTPFSQKIRTFGEREKGKGKAIEIK